MLEYTLNYLINNLNVIPVIGIELEFYFDNIPKNNFTLLINSIKNKLSCFSCNISQEKSELQYEIQTLHTSNISRLISEIDTFKEILQNNAEKFHGNTNFFAKPYLDKPGNAFHVHINLLDKNTNNLFSQQNNEMSTHLLYSIGGLCTLMKKHMIFFAPHHNSYLRYIHADIDTPTTVSWGGNNRSTAIRIPNTTNNPSSCRIEHRVAGADCNYKQVITSILQGIIYGIQNKIQPIPRTYGIASDSQYNLEKLPTSLDESIKHFITDLENNS
ncbi:glutamine synthetase [Ehrlichia ruminantium]|uniref:Glutamine synthetase n=1 Tax=Ehrlichia ruminantium TaxID=779 RepID=A0AAE6Q8N2_EHRRU|nr:glutamine synthetase [Ehrlichia ruminantium]QGR02230.1 glutamine synthetase [Ehrlichia ruminantium]QGR03152.1 glutamine synthetase [Ehrlichia ruminantium]QGR04077.1 glutamine synthetase [Ehrlichia ruminantium]